MREALQRGIPVVTSNKWPVALHGVELAEQARAGSVAVRAESTVMSGTPVLSSLVDGLAGTVPTAVRGLLNATANFILTRMSGGESYADALAEAQRLGLAERDPSADVEGPDTVAKVMILSALVFSRQLRPTQVSCRGITDVARSELVGSDDPLVKIEGTTNAVLCTASPVGEIMISGPGAGPQLAGQGVLSDVIAIARSR